jgi:ribose 1,5-bisphosphate isomerase
MLAEKPTHKAFIGKKPLILMNQEEEYQTIINDIRTVKIQGAEAIAKAGIQAYLLKPTKKSAHTIVNTRPTEPLLQNSLRILEQATNKKKTADLLNHNLIRDHHKIVLLGAKLIKNDMNIYSHCHSSTVIDILKQAKKDKKKFVVYTTEVEPLLQGRMTAEDLSRANIKVVVAPDLAMEQLIKNCDIAFFGADAYTPNFAVNKIGTSALCDFAHHHHIPVYACGVSMKYTTHVTLEQRKPWEVWKKHNPFIKISNPAFDKVPYAHITGIISEKGIMKPEAFLRKMKKNK